METRLIWLLAIPILVLASACAFLVFLLVRYGIWAGRGGSRVTLPWTTQGLPHTSRFAERRRTRDASGLHSADPARCCLVFWKRPRTCKWEPVLRDAITGFTGIETIAADFSLEGGGERWLITSVVSRIKSLKIDGPHYEPWRACGGSALAQVDISGFVDGVQLRDDLEAQIRDRSVRHQRAPWAFVFGRTTPDRVTCSGLIGDAILRQPTSPAAAALRQALRERFTYGEITPADIARAAAILGVREATTGEPFSLTPCWDRRPARGVPDRSTAPSSRLIS